MPKNIEVAGEERGTVSAWRHGKAALTEEVESFLGSLRIEEDHVPLPREKVALLTDPWVISGRGGRGGGRLG